MAMARRCCLEMPVVQCGLNACLGVTDGCWWVVRIAVVVFDELLCVVAGSSGGLKDEWGQVDAGVPVDLFFSSRLAM